MRHCVLQLHCQNRVMIGLNCGGFRVETTLNGVAESVLTPLAVRLPSRVRGTR